MTKNWVYFVASQGPSKYHQKQQKTVENQRKSLKLNGFLFGGEGGI
nr:MAG TPA: hypothetical protein [Caudoviricetes sp.]